MITPATFRADFPEFAAVGPYADRVIAYWIAISAFFFNTDLWGTGATVATAPPTTIYDFGVELFVAHHLAIDRRNAMAAAAGGVPGEATGPVSSKSVGQVSISYDTGASAVKDADFWNLTVYGQQYIRLARQIGSAPQHFGAPSCPPLWSGPAWPGPYPFPAPGGSGFG